MVTELTEKHGVATETSVLHYALIGLAAAAVIFPQFVHPGYYYKIIEHAVMAYRYVPAFVESFREGVYYPAWMAGDFGGYGSPIFIYYSPVFYILSGVLAVTGVGVPLSTSLVELVFIAMGGAGVYLLVRETHGSKAAIAGALCYILLPTRVLDLYYTNTPSGRLSLAWMPYILYFTRGHASGDSGRAHLAGMAFSYAGLILTHLATAYIFTPFIIAYTLFAVKGGRAVKRLARVLAGLVSGIGLSAFLFLPVMLMRDEIHIGLMVAMEDYSVSRNFMFDTGPGSRIPDMAALIRLHALTVIVETLAAGAVYYISRRFADLRPGRETGFFLGSISVCLFMMSSLSLILWEHVPGLSTWSFPYRMAMVYALFLAVTAGIAYGHIIESRKAGRKPAVAASALLVLLAVYSGSLAVKAEPVTVADVKALAGEVDFMEYLPSGVDVAEFMRTGGAGPPLTSKDVFDAETTTWGQAERAFRVSSENGALVRVKTFYFPGWRAWLDGEETPIGVEEGSGAMLIDVPPGRHTVELRYTGTPARTIGAWLGIVTLGALALPYRKLIRL